MYLNKDKHTNVANCIINQPFILEVLRSQGFLSQLFTGMLGRLKTLLLQLSSLNHHPLIIMLSGSLRSFLEHSLS